MTICTKMEVLILVVGIIASMFMSTSAQTGECWERMSNCTRRVSSPGEFEDQCCPVLNQEIRNERECFCGIKPLLRQNATDANNFAQLLMLCEVTASLDTLCPDNFQEAPCWKTINNCIGENVNNSRSEPQLNPSSPLFNATEFLCCPLMQQNARTERHCFCTISTFIQQNPSHAKNTTDLLSVCGIADSATSLDGLCPGQAPSPAPVSPLQGSIVAESLVTDGSKKTPAQGGAASKIATTGSTASLFILLACFLFL